MIENSIQKIRTKLGKKPVRFIAVGALNSGFSFTLYSALISLGESIALSSLAALIAGMLLGFLTQGTIVFKNATRFTFIRYISAWIILYLFNLSLISAGGWLGLNPYSAAAAAMLPAAVFSYVILDRYVFKIRQHGELEN